MQIGITGTQGSHPNFLSYALNIVLNGSNLFDIPTTITFDNLVYPEGRFNVDIKYLEDNFFDFQQSLLDTFPRSEDRIHINTNPIMTVFGDDSRVAKKKI